MDIGVARQKVGHKVALQGNLDPAVLFATPEVIRAETEHVLASYGYGSGHVFNLGHVFLNSPTLTMLRCWCRQFMN